ncbi:hypothetical protein [Kordiimonas sp.]|uniref:PglD-related sugar-binding protein n=1 Tax=Kordiimonas sp. TaxID=1970157 RepID=UPI003A95D5A2
MKHLVIIGSGRHAAVVQDCAPKGSFTLLGHVCDHNPKGSACGNLSVLGPLSILPDLMDQFGDLCGVIGVGNNSYRIDIANTIEQMLPSFKWVSVTHESAIVSSSAVIEPGAVLMPGTIVNTGTRIGRHALINTGSIIEHDNVIESFASTGSRATTGGNVRLGRASHLGIGATVRQDITIGNSVVVGGQSFVCSDLEDGGLYYGVPAKKIRNRIPDDQYL